MMSAQMTPPINRNHTEDQKVFQITLEERDIAFVTAFVVIFVVGVIGNLLVCYVFKNGKRKLSTMENLIFRLAIVDLFASILNPCLYIYWQVTRNKMWHFGIVGCKILPSLNYFTDSLSIGIIVLISIDRGHKICRPLAPSYTAGQINIGFLVIVCIAICMEVPRLIHADVVPDHTCLVYNALKPTFAYPTLTMLTLRDVICTVIFLVVFYHMYKVLYRCKPSLLGRMNRTKEKRKAFVLLVSMTILFIILVFPRDVLHIVYVTLLLTLKNFKPAHTIHDINVVFKILRSTNSIVNVFLYAGLHNGFRKRLHNISSSMRLTKSQDSRSTESRKSFRMADRSSLSFKKNSEQHGTEKKDKQFLLI